MAEPSMTRVCRVVRGVDDPRDWLAAIATELSGVDDPAAKGIAAALVPVLECQAGWGHDVGEWPVPALARVMASDRLSRHYGYWHLLVCAIGVYSLRRRELAAVMQLQSRIVEVDDIEF